MFYTEFGGEFHSSLRGSLGRIEDPLALKLLTVCVHFSCEVYLMGRP
jgi:hypothetical protein